MFSGQSPKRLCQFCGVVLFPTADTCLDCGKFVGAPTESHFPHIRTGYGSTTRFPRRNRRQGTSQISFFLLLIGSIWACAISLLACLFGLCPWIIETIFGVMALALTSSKDRRKMETASAILMCLLVCLDPISFGFGLAGSLTVDL